jgi:hypothetical protein
MATKRVKVGEDTAKTIISAEDFAKLVYNYWKNDTSKDFIPMINVLKKEEQQAIIIPERGQYRNMEFEIVEVENAEKSLAISINPIGLMLENFHVNPKANTYCVVATHTNDGHEFIIEGTDKSPMLEDEVSGCTFRYYWFDGNNMVSSKHAWFVGFPGNMLFYKEHGKYIVITTCTEDLDSLGRLRYSYQQFHAEEAAYKHAASMKGETKFFVFNDHI